MNKRDYKLFIVEGEAREPLIIHNISKIFFTNGNLKVITLPAGENIYMLWKKLKEDDFDTDIIDVSAMRVSCLLGLSDTLKYEQYSEIINPYKIYVLEEKEIQNEEVFVLSGFPEFLVDYFGIKLWKKCVQHAKNQMEKNLCKLK